MGGNAGPSIRTAPAIATSPGNAGGASSGGSHRDSIARIATAGEAAAMTDQSHEKPQDLRNLVRVVSACTLGLWAFAAGLLIGVFLFS